ncbi:MAG: hypothetical protein QXJ93_01805 [Candidatus Rehaiarchaeum fermentans]|nr:hypothetical protein [Candidatus Rehaiarchaeum fermentans]MCW1293285.1 hypothetical protein [Candidatus Rehaiarchaeum fermentans]MCW1311562.1 hypothetical protein [Candidatus Rehaiarchaeum fermentans]
MEVIIAILLGIALAYIFVKRNLIDFLIGIDMILLLISLVFPNIIFLLVLGALEAAVGVAIGAIVVKRGRDIQI